MSARILFVDDEPNILSGLRRMLRSQRREWDMRFANSGAEALDMLQDFDANIVVSDMRMPQMDGSELLNRVAQQHPNTMRLVLSGQAERDATFRVVGSSHQFFQKPCDQDRLIRTVNRFISHSDSIANAELLTALVSLPGLANLGDTGPALVGKPTSDGFPSQPERIARHDIALAAKMLQLANSAYFGVGNITYAPDQALSMLGIDFLTVLLNFHDLIQPQQDGAIGELQSKCHDMGRVARHYVCGRLPELQEDVSHDAVRTAALLAPLGRLALIGYQPDAYAGTTDVGTTEARAFGLDSLAISAALCDLWGIPSPVSDLISAVANPDTAPNGLDAAAEMVTAAVHWAEKEVFSPRPPGVQPLAAGGVAQAAVTAH